MNPSHPVTESLHSPSDTLFRRISKDIVVTQTLALWSQDWDVRWIFESVVEYLRSQRTKETHEIWIRCSQGISVLRMNKNSVQDFSCGGFLLLVQGLEGFWLFDLKDI